MFNLRNNRTMKFLTTVTLFVSIFIFGSQTGAEPVVDALPLLFSKSGGEIPQDVIEDPKVIRRRLIEVNFDLLPDPDDKARDQADIGGRIGLNLFDDTVFTVVPERLESVTSRSFSWIGHVEGDSHSRVILVYKDQKMVGTISVSGALYKVRPIDESTHVIDQQDQSVLPPEADPIHVDLPEENPSESKDEMMADVGSFIDIMVLYTPAARLAVGGTTSMELLISNAISETNDSFALSGINPRLQLVHYAEVSYTESGSFSTDLSRLRGTSDGYMDEIHTWRDTYTADEVSLLIDDPTYCGMGYIMTTVSTAFASNAFYLVYWTCATGNFSFGHELGHNMAARHDWYVDDTTGSPYSYNHGYINRQDKWRTIMAYNNACSDGGLGSCTRLQYWSNPDVTYGGDPMGVPAGTSTSCVEGVLDPDCDADNRLTLNNTAWTVANFRVSDPPPANDDFDNAEIILSSPYTDILDISSATTAGDDPTFACVSGQRYKTTWYRYSPSRNGLLTINTYDSNYDTVLAVWTGPRGSLVSQACNDDAVGQQSEVSFFAISGVMYRIEIASYSEVGSGELHLSLQFDPRNITADFDGDGTSEVVVFRSGAWLFYDYETATFETGVWTGSTAGCIPAPMDYDGDGRVEFSQLCNGAWNFYNDDGSLNKGIWTGGVAGDLPVPADYDGDGTDEVVVWRSGAWLFYDFETGSFDSGVWTGSPPHWTGGTTRPVPMDYDGDGTADFTVFAGGPWHFYNDDGSYNKGIWTGGVPGDLAVSADYDGDGTEDPTVWRSGAWLVYDYGTGSLDYGVWTGSPPHWTGGTTLPAPLDYDGDGEVDFTVFAGGPWHFYNDDGSYNKGIWTGGVMGDLAISRRHLP